jgi:patatin-like phospholipase/acyl hydrolase
VVIGVLILGPLTYLGAFTIYEIDHSVYDRKKVDNLLDMHFGEFGVRDAVPDDLFMISYSYNFGIPRFYTKHFAQNNEKDYDIRMDVAALASAATPFMFDPVTRKTFNNKKLDEELLIDGSVIANNPSLYALVYAKHHR